MRLLCREGLAGASIRLCHRADSDVSYSSADGTGCYPELKGGKGRKSKRNEQTEGTVRGEVVRLPCDQALLSLFQFSRRRPHQLLEEVERTSEGWGRDGVD